MESMGRDQQSGDALYARQVLQATERAMECAAAVSHEDLKHGLNTLATITCIAPLVGMLGTSWALLFDTFRGIGTDRYTVLAMDAEGISRALVPTALGLLAGLLSLWGYRYFRDRLADFDLEMANTSLALVNQLSLHLGRLRTAGPIESVSRSLPYLEAYSPDLDAERRYERRAASAAVTLVLVAWCVQVIAYFELDAIPLNSALSAGVRSVAIVFCFSCLPAYAVWVDFLHRKPTRVALIGAALCLFWCAIGLFFPALRF
jgi:hypothetical protein